MQLVLIYFYIRNNIWFSMFITSFVDFPNLIFLLITRQITHFVATSRWSPDYSNRHNSLQNSDNFCKPNWYQNSSHMNYDPSLNFHILSKWKHNTSHSILSCKYSSYISSCSTIIINQGKLHIMLRVSTLSIPNAN